MVNYAIQKRIPVPPRVGAWKYQMLPTMEVGDSFHCPDEQAPRAAWEYGRRNGKKFMRRKERGGYRVWRVA